jgi:hypothetical protein
MPDEGPQLALLQLPTQQGSARHNEEIADRAVLLLVFNRPDTTARVVQTLATACPHRLYIAADGPRPNRDGEVELCEQTRRIATDISWPCEVSTLFRSENLGCRRAVADAITWFFDHEEAGIILEDDCVPDQSFFSYADELLSRYRDEPRVMAISGDNFVGSNVSVQDSYYFSRYPHIWGWATWRRAWALYDGGMSAWPELRVSGWLEGFSAPDVVRYWTDIFDRTHEETIDTWDYQWVFSCLMHGGLSATPARNLVSNIGFRDDATHTTGDSRWADRPTGSLPLPLVHPPNIAPHELADRWTEANVLRAGSGRLRRALSRMFGGST